MSILVLLLHPCDVLHLAQTGTEILKQACCQMFCLTKSLHVCLNCKTLGNDVWAFCNLCHLPMCRPGHSMPSFHRPRMFTTTFESDWNQHRNRWNVPRLTWTPHLLALLLHFWCLIQDIKDTQMLHFNMHFVTAVTVTLNDDAESLNPGHRPHTPQVVELAEYSDTSSDS